MKLKTVYDLFRSQLDPLSEYGKWGSHERVEFLKEIPLNSHVGECSRVAIHKARELVATLDSHPDISQRILGAVVFHIHILMYG